MENTTNDYFTIEKDKVKNLYYNALGMYKIYKSECFNNTVLAGAEAGKIMVLEDLIGKEELEKLLEDEKS